MRMIESLFRKIPWRETAVFVPGPAKENYRSRIFLSSYHLNSGKLTPNPEYHSRFVNGKGIDGILRLNRKRIPSVNILLGTIQNYFHISRKE